MNNKMQFVNQYVDKGYFMFPTHANDKRPCIDNWKENCSSNADELNPIYIEHPELNLAVVTGKKSGIFVIDVDNKKGKKGIETLSKLENELGRLPSTYMVKTPNGGYHYYFKYPTNLMIDKLGNKVNFADGLDVRSDNAYVLAPPSVIDGNEYKVINNVELKDIPVEWINYIYNTEYKIEVKASRNGKSIIIPLRKEFELPSVIDDGSRNDTLLRYGGHLIGKGVPYEDIINEIHEINKNRCNTPLRDDEIENTILKSLDKYHNEHIIKTSCKESIDQTRQDNFSWLIVNKNSYNIDELKYAVYYRQDVKETNLYFNGMNFIDKSSNVIKQDEIEQDIMNEIGEFIQLGVMKKVQAIMGCLERVCLYDKYLTLNESRDIYSTKCDRFLHYNDKKKCYELKEVEDIRPRVNAVNVAFDPTLPEQMQNLDIEINAPYFHKWITDLMTQENIDILQEYIGYSMCASTNAQMALQIEGAAGIGKSRIYDILSLILGTSKISSCSICDLENENYLAPLLVDKLVLYDDDIKVQSLKDTGLLKKLITINGEMLSVRQIYGAPFQSQIFTKIIACGNHMINSIYDKSDGLWRRFILLHCKPKDPNRKEIKYDVFMENWQKELPYIFLWALTGLERLIKNNWTFSHQEIIVANRKELKNNSDSVENFLANVVKITNDENDLLSKEQVYAIYCEYCDLYDVHKLSRTSFMRDFTNKTKDQVRDCVARIEGKNVRVFRGIRKVESTFTVLSNEQIENIKGTPRNNIIQLVR